MQQENNSIKTNLSFPTPPLPSPRSCGRQKVRSIGATPTLYPVQKHYGMTSVVAGFTLIELLVVVLIIGILAAIALPQYQKAVEKSKGVQAFTLLKTLGEAGKIYYMANGEYPNALDELAVDIPAWVGNDSIVNGWSEIHSSKDWNITYKSKDHMRMERLSGRYRGAGFQWQFSGTTETLVPTNQVICIEHSSFQPTAGSYCAKLFGGTQTPYSGASRVYKLP